MKTRFFNWILVAAIAGGVTAACADDDHVTDGTGGANQGGKANTGGSGARGGAPSTGGTSVAGEGGATTSTGGSAGAPEGGAAGSATSGGTNPGAGGMSPGAGGTSAGSGGVVLGNGGSTAGSGGVLVGSGGVTQGQGGTGTGAVGGAEGGAGGFPEPGGAGGQGGEGGEGGAAVDPLVQRGEYLVVTVAQCGGCHTANNSTQFLGGNPNYRVGATAVPAPNLTSDPTGLGDWTDAEIKRALREGIDDEGRQLSAGMPYWLYHNLTDADADAIVAYLRSVPKVQNIVGDSNAAATAVTPLSPSAFPSTSLTSGAEFESAQRGKYLLTSAARCVSCHSVLTNGVPAPAFSGRGATSSGLVYPANLTPDATGIGGWSANDVATVLLTYTAKGTTTPLCNMPRYTGLTPEDALAIGHYLTTIPAVENVAASLPDLPACLVN